MQDGVANNGAVIAWEGVILLDAVARVTVEFAVVHKMVGAPQVQSVMIGVVATVMPFDVNELQIVLYTVLHRDAAVLWGIFDF